MAEIKFDDNLLVNRDDETYKVSGSRFLSGFTSPPDINRIDLTETNPGNLPRFTNQSFVASVTMDDEGEPISTKTFDAYVEGAILANGKFDAPLLNMLPGTKLDYTSGIVPSGTGGQSWYDSEGAGGHSMFDGSLTTRVYPAGGSELTVNFDPPLSGTCETWSDQSEGNIFWTEQTSGSSGASIPPDVVPQWRPVGEFEAVTQMRFQQFGVNTFSTYALRINGEILVDVAAPPPKLVFPDGIDMSFLAPGDRVDQPTAPKVVYSNDVASTSGNYSVEYSKQAEPIYAFDGRDNVAGFPAGCIATNDVNDKLVWDVSNIDIAGKELQIVSGRLYQNYDLYTGGANGTLVYSTGRRDDGTAAGVIVVPDGNTYDYDTVVISTTQASHPATISRALINGFELIDNGDITGVVGSIEGTTVQLSSGTSYWTNDLNVIGPDKQLLIENARKYLAFGDTGTVTALIDNPQSPAYTTTDENPSLTLTFPSTFSSGNTPDDELGEGVTLTVTATAENGAGISGPVGDTVQPDDGLVQFVEPLQSSTINYLEYSNEDSLYLAGATATNAIYDREKAFDGDTATFCSTNESAAGYIQVDFSALPNKSDLSNKRIQFWCPPDSPGAYSVYVKDGNTDTAAQNNIAGGGWLDFGIISDPNYLYVSPYGGGFPKVAAIKIDNEILQDGVIAIGADLNFAAGTDMSALEDGDEVTQNTEYNGTWSSYLTADGGINDPTLAFDGSASTYAYTNGNAFMFWEPGFLMTEKMLLETTKSFTNFTVEVTDASGTIYSSQVTSDAFNQFEINTENRLLTKIAFKPTDGSFFGLRYITYGNRFLVKDGDSLNSTLRGTVASIASTTVTLGDNSGGWANGADVVGPVKQVIRSMTEEELKEQKLKFATYENRKDTACGEAALAAREQLRTALVEAGYTLPEIDTTYAYITGEPQAIDGYYPLFDTEAEAEAAGNGSAHTHEIDGVTYYMPDGGTPIYHGNYTVSNTDNNDTNSNNNGGY